MPPKKKGKAKKGNGNNEGDEERAESKPTEREILLSQQLETLSDELTETKRNVDELRKENEWLQEEAQQTRRESHEYMAYMARKTQKRQSAIVSLNDNNQEKLSQIQKQKEEMTAYYEQLKNELKDQMLEKETELSSAKKELTELEQYQKFQWEQYILVSHISNKVYLHAKVGQNGADICLKLKAYFYTSNYYSESESPPLFKFAPMNQPSNVEGETSLARSSLSSMCLISFLSKSLLMVGSCCKRRDIRQVAQKGRC
ncbi:Hypothetical predicted protein, partial [Paramuricea clavata]